MINKRYDNSRTNFPPHGRYTNEPANEIFLVLDGLPERLTEVFLDKVLELGIDVAPDGVGEDGFHAGHEYLQPLDHRYHLN